MGRMTNVPGYTQPLIAVDVVPLAFDKAYQRLGIGVAERANDPFKGEWSLPGVLLGSGERLREAAYRALADKAGVTESSVAHLVQVGAFDGPGRDPRDEAISISFLAVIRDTDDTSLSMIPYTDDFTALPFDHGTIVAAAKNLAKMSLWDDGAFTESLLDSTFSTSHAAYLTEAVTGAKPEPGNFNRFLRGNAALQSLGKQAVGDLGRSTTVWGWAR